MHPAAVVAVACSGGRDSTALLHATAVSSQVLGVRVFALHVHHGLSENADRWAAHCAALCQTWQGNGLPVGFLTQRLVGKPAKGESVEAWARSGRLLALRDMSLACGASLILLAHHRRDQAETFLLQALRGAGVAGLAGMPRVVHRDGLTWARPWLDRASEDIDAYVRCHRLQHVDDESNQDVRFGRNRLRLRVWPVFNQSFDDAETSLAAAAAWAQEAATALAELAEMDLARVANGSGFDLHQWCLLSSARRSNALRAWLKAQTGSAPTAALIRRLQAEAHAGSNARWSAHGGELRAYRGILSYVKHLPAQPDCAAHAARASNLCVRRAGTHRLHGWGGQLQVIRVKEGGVPFAWLAQLELRAREGGERFQAGVGRPPRSLKRQYQVAAVPAWDRGGPLVYCCGKLVYAPGLGLDARVVGLTGQSLVTLRWLPDERRPEVDGPIDEQARTPAS